MRQLVYALRFVGRASPASSDGSVLVVKTIAMSCTLTVTVGPVGLASELRPAAGGEAEFAAELTITGETSFQEVGTIAFGDGNMLRFASVGSGYLGSCPDSACKHGGVMWRVTGGEGQFVGASGLIASNVVIGDDLVVADHHFGVIFVP